MGNSLVRCTAPAVSSDEINIGSAAFFEPLTPISPFKPLTALYDNPVHLRSALVLTKLR